MAVREKGTILMPLTRDGMQEKWYTKEDNKRNNKEWHVREDVGGRQ